MEGDYTVFNIYYNAKDADNPENDNQGHATFYNFSVLPRVGDFVTVDTPGPKFSGRVEAMRFRFERLTPKTPNVMYVIICLRG